MTPKQSGVALVEFALALPILLVVSMITIDYGRAMYQYNVLTKSVRDAARFLSAQTPGDTTKYATAKNLVVYGNPTGTGSPLVIGLSTSLVPDPQWQLAGAGPIINTVRIRISGYVFRPMLGSVFGLTFGNINYADISATMRGAL